MSRKELLNVISKQCEINVSQVEQILDAFVNKVKHQLLNNDEVRIHNFGTFSVLAKKERKGYDPYHKKPLVIKKQSTVKFQPSKVLKDGLNNR